MEIKYPLGPYNKEDAYQLVDTFLDKLQAEHADSIKNASKTWNDNKDMMNFQFNAMNFDIKGDIKIHDDHLILNSKLPLLARVFSGTIEDTIVKNLDQLFIQ